MSEISQIESRPTEFMKVGDGSSGLSGLSLNVHDSKNSYQSGNEKKQSTIKKMIGYDKVEDQEQNSSSDSLTDELDEDDFDDMGLEFEHKNITQGTVV